VEKKQVIRSAGVVSFFTMLSRVLGLVRDVFMTSFFGTSLAASAFIVAFRLPNLFRRLFGEGALSAAFVPVFINIREKEGEAASWDLARRVISVAALLLSAIALALVLFATVLPHLVDLSEKWVLVCSLSRITLPYMIFICLTALAMGILNSYRHFAVPAATPCILNIVWIIAMVTLGKKYGIYGVAFGILIAGVFQLSAQLPMLVKVGYRPRFELAFRDPQVMRVIRLAIPAALGAAVFQINVLIDSLIAYQISDAAAAALFYSERLIYLPLGIFATALGTVLLPVFSKQAADDQEDKIRTTINYSLRNLLFVMIPASMGLLFLATPIIQTLFQWNEFDAESTRYTALALKFYAPGLLVFSLVKVFIPAFYAREDTKTPIKLGMISVAINLTLNITFVLTWPAEYKHAGLACATVIAEGIYALLLARVLHRRYGSPGWSSIILSAVKFVPAAVLMGFACHKSAQLFTLWLGQQGLGEKLTWIISTSGAIGVGAAVYFALAALFRCRELREIRDALLRKKRS
jgi:putative peptidoglycan lipid II flippase